MLICCFWQWVWVDLYIIQTTYSHTHWIGQVIHYFSMLCCFMINDILPGSCMCHVFYSSSAGQVAEVLTSISDGFSRTHFAVWAKPSSSQNMWINLQNISFSTFFSFLRGTHHYDYTKYIFTSDTRSFSLLAAAHNILPAWLTISVPEPLYWKQ